MVLLLLLVAELVEGEGVDVKAAEEGVWATTPTSMDDESGDEIPAFEFDMEAACRLLLLLLSSAAEALLLLLGIGWRWRLLGCCCCGCGGGGGPWCGCPPMG